MVVIIYNRIYPVFLRRNRSYLPNHHCSQEDKRLREFAMLAFELFRAPRPLASDDQPELGGASGLAGGLFPMYNWGISYN